MIGFPGCFLDLLLDEECIFGLIELMDYFKHFFAGSRQLQKHYERGELPWGKSRKEIIVHLLHLRRVSVKKSLIA